MQEDAFVEFEDYSDKRILIGLSGGINSAAIICFLATEYPKEYLPKEIHFFYAHFDDHSPDTMDFVLDCVKYSYQKFNRVFVKITHQSMEQFCTESNMIPHPTNSACSRLMKREPIMEYYDEQDLDFDLVGYVRSEKNRIERQQSYNNAQSKNKAYPIITMTDHDCEVICEKEIGWIPAIYKIKDNNGKRLFKHNNCLPCKNMHDKEMKVVKEHFPDYYDRALKLTKKLSESTGKEIHWGRTDEIDELICPTCEWD
jgi:3'-phosphoadenosine 5'-phosphosulfate sulfotransferase (PAPS reductase)/FAD synthetase